MTATISDLEETTMPCSQSDAAPVPLGMEILHRFAEVGKMGDKMEQGWNSGILGTLRTRGRRIMYRTLKILDASIAA